MTQKFSKMSDASSQIRRKHLQDVNLLHRESPYGNFYTPVIKSRIVGGKLIHIREDDPAYRSSPRDLVGRHPLSPRSRSRADAAAAADAVETRRQEKVKLRQDQLLTAGEGDQERGNDPHAGSTGGFYNGGYEQQQQQQGSDRRHGLNPYEPLPPIGGGGRWGPAAMETAARLLNGLYGKLPPYTARIMGSQLQLSRDEELAVMRELQTQLRYVDIGALKRVYSELAAADDQLTGLCMFDQLSGALVRNNIYLSNPIARVVASAFLSPYDPPQVNYEKVLSFIGASIQLGVGMEHQPGQHDGSYYQQQPQQYEQQQHLAAANGLPSGYYTGGGGGGATERSHYHTEEQHAFDPHRQPTTPPQSPPPSPPPPPQSQGMSSDRDLPRVLRQLESEVAAILAAGPHDQRGPLQQLNFESLRQAFQRADRQHRGTLSADQMKRLVWDFRLPLSQQVLDSAVALCRHRGGGQYDWEQFVALLERVVAPQSTGLRIPDSRRPADYARQLPEPSASWPHAEPGPPPPPLPPQAVGTAMPLYRTPSPPPQQQQQQQQYPYSSRSGAGQLPAEPWFNRFMKLASALYRRDSEARGFVSESQVKDLVDSYNDHFHLGLDPDDVQSALEASRLDGGGRGGGGGGVNINELLKRLSVKPGGA